MKRWIASAHVQMDVEAETEEQARDIIRNRVLGAGMRFTVGTAPSHAVNGVGLAVPLAERVKATDIAAPEQDVEAAAAGLGIEPLGRTLISQTAMYWRADAQRIAQHLRVPLLEFTPPTEEPGDA